MIIIPKKTFYNLDEEKKNRITNAAIKEFSINDFSNAKISKIIKDANIPRGSFYQYFENIDDLAIYILDIISKTKKKYINETIKNPKAVPFLKLFREIYLMGVKFSIDYPKYVRVVANNLKTNNEIYTSYIKDNEKYALILFKELIDLDKDRGNIKKNINTDTFARLILDLTNNITLLEFSKNSNEINYNVMINQITNIITILETGVKGDGLNV